MYSNSNLDCVFCGNEEESSFDSLLTCRLAGMVWKYMTEWIGLNDFKADSFKESFSKWSNYLLVEKWKEGKKESCGWQLVGAFGIVGAAFSLETICEMQTMSFGAQKLWFEDERL